MLHRNDRGRGWNRVTLKDALKISATPSKPFTGLSTARLTTSSIKKLSNFLICLYLGLS
jgi:hypothetical protein